VVTMSVVLVTHDMDMDALLHSGPFALNWGAEFGGISLIALNAWAAGQSRG